MQTPYTVFTPVEAGASISYFSGQADQASNRVHISLYFLQLKKKKQARNGDRLLGVNTVAVEYIFTTFGTFLPQFKLTIIPLPHQSSRRI